ncbi:hypothetical protein DFH06DRAFT_1135129 [Mycena polygramma]|nr:hypothetical protein DFH06DRAFT_1135129 [Mycena polygramma]
MCVVFHKRDFLDSDVHIPRQFEQANVRQLSRLNRIPHPDKLDIFKILADIEEPMLREIANISDAEMVKAASKEHSIFNVRRDSSLSGDGSKDPPHHRERIEERGILNASLQAQLEALESGEAGLPDCTLLNCLLHFYRVPKKPAPWTTRQECIFSADLYFHYYGRKSSFQIIRGHAKRLTDDEDIAVPASGSNHGTGNFGPSG